MSSVQMGTERMVKNRKRLKTADGTIDLEVPRGRASSFEPQAIKKQETILAESLESKIIGMYGHGMSLRDTFAHIKEMYDSEAIRRLIYTTNTIEGLLRQVREVTETKGAFTFDMALLKLIYLATQNIQKSGHSPSGTGA